MKEQQKKLINISVWWAIVLFVLRCVISWKSVISNFSLYSIFGYASEAIGIAVIIVVLYEKYLWKFNPFETTPKLASRYYGSFKSNYDSIERNAELIVKQTLLSVHVIMITDESKSKSLSASIENVLGEVQLTYCYLNTPKSEHRGRSEIHYGTAMLSVSNPKEISGQYYTDRQTTGDMRFVLKP